MAEARRRVRMKLLLCDAGYDAEWIHWAARLAFQTRTIIPPTRGRPTKKLPRQYYRRKMARLFKLAAASEGPTDNATRPKPCSAWSNAASTPP